jgi:hypothetical protein
LKPTLKLLASFLVNRNTYALFKVACPFLAGLSGEVDRALENGIIEKSAGA